MAPPNAATHLMRFLEVMRGSRMAAPTRLAPVMKMPLQGAVCTVCTGQYITRAARGAVACDLPAQPAAAATAEGQAAVPLSRPRQRWRRPSRQSASSRTQCQQQTKQRRPPPPHQHPAIPHPFPVGGPINPICRLLNQPSLSHQAAPMTDSPTHRLMPRADQK